MGVFDRLKLPKGKRSLESGGGSGREEKKNKHVAGSDTERQKPCVFDRLRVSHGVVSEKAPGRVDRKQFKKGKKNGQQGKGGQGSGQTRKTTTAKGTQVKKKDSRDLQQHGMSRKGRGASSGCPVAKASTKAQGDGAGVSVGDGITRGIQVNLKEIDTQGLMERDCADGQGMKQEVNSDNKQGSLMRGEAQPTEAQRALSAFLESNDSAIAKNWHRLQWDWAKVYDHGPFEKGDATRLLEMANALHHSA